jgi:glutathione synthase
MKLAFIIDPIEYLDPGHDTSVAIMEAAQLLGHEVWMTSITDLSAIAGKAWAKLTRIELVPVELKDNHWVAVSQWYQRQETVFTCLENFNFVWMRKDPPVTIAYLYATYLLDLIDPKKTKVINSTRGLRHANEKLYTIHFAQVMPATIVSQDKATIREFVNQKGAAVMKPLGGKAGEGILFLSPEDRNLNSMIEISTKWGQEPVMIQDYLPAAQEGDKRIIVLNGEPIGAVNRIPTGSEFRGNMAVGGRVAKTEITDRELEICATLAPKLREDGLYFVGLDVIGGYLTEVNVTSPTGIREIDRLNNVSLAQQVIQWLENLSGNGEYFH